MFNRKPTLSTLVFALILAVATVPAHSQVVIKRAKCAEANDDAGPGYQPKYFHRNQTTDDQIVTVQVIRDGCRPKAENGVFYHYTRNPVNGAGAGMHLDREGRSTTSNSLEIPAGWLSVVEFINNSGAPTRGTFDYITILH